MKIHICLYKNNQEIVNYNEVEKIEKLGNEMIYIKCKWGEAMASTEKIDKIEVDFYE